MKKNQQNEKPKKEAEDSSSEDDEAQKTKQVHVEDFDRNLIGTEFVNSDDDEGFSRGSAGNDDY
jgi:hypothetical protein